jgi:hypothetical protein
MRAIYGELTLGDVVVVKWKLLNPFSFLNDFDRWFAFEAERSFHEDGWIPDSILRNLYARCVSGF